MKQLAKIFTLTLLALIVSYSTQAQQEYKVNGNVEMKVSGTSTLHDWEMVSGSASGSALIQVENDQIQNVENLKLWLKGESLKSDHSGMDKNAYEALETEDHPNIKYVLQELRDVQVGDDKTTMKAVGKLTIAGNTRTISFNVTGKMVNGKIQFTGDTAFKLTDFDIDPPTAMLGTIKTGDRVSIDFNVYFKPE